jgi:glucuronate isomerase
MENGELPNDEEMIGALVEKVCYRNAEGYFGLQL